MLSTAQADPTPWLPLPDLDDWVDGDAPADTERANNYYRARYYDPKIGRFISEDPIGFGGGINFFAYVLNNPVRYIDPFGLEAGNLNRLVPGPNGEVARILPLPPDPTGARSMNPVTVRDQVAGWQKPQWAHDMDESDRVRHCIVECRITREFPMFGAEVAELAGLIQDLPPSGDPDDRRAGRIGRCVAGNKGSCMDECLDQLRRGRFY